MFSGGIILSVTLILFAVWLQWNERQGWPGEESEYDDKTDADYLRSRFRSRRRIHWIIGVCGLLILIATVKGPESRAVWIGCWSIVMLCLITVVGLALLDAVRTHRYHRRRLPELRRKMLGDDD
ncbi:hypothetical protein [Crateriforma spongiae]|uniref:hypothetical protein n=1 Tax=Crateriforma spongiae TaxID=2724528 RepID=UPI001444B7EC|nr:hypothetical protein [Crateriforma spongiae]